MVNLSHVILRNPSDKVKVGPILSGALPLLTCLFT